MSLIGPKHAWHRELVKIVTRGIEPDLGRNIIQLNFFCTCMGTKRRMDVAHVSSW